MRPVARFTLLLAIIDDFMDTASQEEIEAATQRVFALFTGLEDAEPPAKFIGSILDLITRYDKEKERNAKSTPPSTAVYRDIRRQTSGGICYASDFISLPKELARGGDVMNLVAVVQNESQLSLEEEARARALEIHNESLDELIRLQNTLPDFGEWQKIAREYADDMGVLVQGVYSWHIQSSGRYVAGAYVEPAHLAGGRVD
ncbi:hypothetical protein TWF217_006428 [Orbilia oligospora]|nr:hypothetical protein TWF217_006428 [Orbilia oligospora]